MTPRMLAALTGLPESFAMVTGMPASFAACANSFAGRACSPCDEPMRTVRVIGHDVPFGRCVSGAVSVGRAHGSAATCEVFAIRRGRRRHRRGARRPVRAACSASCSRSGVRGEVRTDEEEVGGSRSTASDSTCRRRACKARPASCRAHAESLGDERAGRTSAAHHEDPHRSYLLPVNCCEIAGSRQHAPFRPCGNLCRVPRVGGEPT